MPFFHPDRVSDSSGKTICAEAGRPRLKHNRLVRHSPFRLDHQSEWIHPSHPLRAARSMRLRAPPTGTPPTRRCITTSSEAPSVEIGTVTLVFLPPRRRGGSISTIGTVSQSQPRCHAMFARVHSLCDATVDNTTGPRMAERLLLDIQYECARNNVDLPWDRIAHRMSKFPSSSAGIVV